MMQAITMAIGPAGVTEFTKELVAADLVAKLAALAPPDRDLGVPDFRHDGSYTTEYWTNISVNLSGGHLTGFAPAYTSVAQAAGGQFVVTFTAPAFTANYSWGERYQYLWCSPDDYGRSHCNPVENKSNSFGYNPTIGGLVTTVTLGFTYDQGSNSYDATVVGSSGQPSNVNANIPGGSVVQQEDAGCGGSHVSDTTSQAISAIPFDDAISTLFPPLIDSIPASGKLTPDITYDFAVGDSGMSFPGDAGIAIGVTGTVNYKDQVYPGAAPTPLPVPPPPAAPDHIQVYVSDYELNALHWAYFQAGLLGVTVHPTDLQDPDILKVKTYIAAIAAFKPYAADAMTAHVTPKAAPVVAFAEVYELTEAAMTSLQGSLPSDVFALLGGMAGNNYATVASLEADLTAANVPPQYWATPIEATSKVAGLVVTQNLEFKLTIENGAPALPEVVFDLQRTDILQKLALGLTAGGAQTLQYAFQRVSYAATFVSTTVPHFDRDDFGDLIWPAAGEPRYEEALAAMGSTGVPLPMMEGFHFVFDQAKLNIQQGFVSVLSQVNFASQSHG